MKIIKNTQNNSPGSNRITFWFFCALLEHFRQVYLHLQYPQKTKKSLFEKQKIQMSYRKNNERIYNEKLQTLVSSLKT